MVPSKGGSDLYLYNLHSAAVFLLDRDEARVGKGADQIIKLIDVDAFVAWLRDTVGDAALADAIAAVLESPQKLGAEARAHAERHFDIRRSAEQYRALYEAVLRERR